MYTHTHIYPHKCAYVHAHTHPLAHLYVETFLSRKQSFAVIETQLKDSSTLT